MGEVNVNFIDKRFKLPRSRYRIHGSRAYWPRGKPRTHKRCPHCKRVKHLSEFQMSNGSPRYCKECHNAKCREWTRINKGRRREIGRNAARIRRANNPEQKEIDKRNRLMVRYGVTPDQVDQAILNQSGKCLICGDGTVKLFIDHCHSTMKFRGMLCCGCNSGIGNFKDDISRLENAIKYLKSSHL